MNKLLFTPLLLLTASVATAATLSVKDLNLEIGRILQPFQTNETIAQVVFSKLEANSERALSAGVAILYRKTGSQNTLEINVPELSYEYGDGSAPTTMVKGSVKLDLTKIISQDKLNDLIPGVEDTIKMLATNFTQEYGDAVTVETEITEKNQDASGNYISVSGNISFSIDMSKLPQTVRPEDVPVLSGSVMLGVDVNSGATFDATVKSNPAYKAFNRDNAGLKEYIDRLLAKDPQLLRSILDAFTGLDRYAGSIVEGEK